MIGYGLDDVKTKNGNIEDERFNPKFNNKHPEHDKFMNTLCWPHELIKNEVFLLYNLSRLSKHNELHIENEIRTIKKILQDKYELTSQLFFHYPRYGLDNVCIFVPVDYPAWSRYDDDIDYCESDPYNKETNIKVLEYGIFPYTDKILKHGRKLSDYDKMLGIQEKITYHQFNIEKNMSNIIKEDINADFDIDLDYDYRFDIPLSLIMIWDLLDVFIDIEYAINEVKPMLYTLWH